MGNNRKGQQYSNKFDSLRRDYSNTSSKPTDPYKEYLATLHKMGRPKMWVKGDNAKMLISEVCDPMAKSLHENKMTSSQLRRFFDEVRILSSPPFDIAKIPLLKAKLAYATGRKRALYKGFYSVISDVLDHIEDKDDFEGFRELLLGIIAYHKYHEQGDNK